MSSTAADNDLVLYHYHFSPFGQKVVWYLTLRGIDYAECLQPMTIPRPDLESLNIFYRRIPVLAHGRSLHCDTRQILTHLDKLFPPSSSHPSLNSTSGPSIAYTHLLEKWVIEAGIFGAAANCLPTYLPTLNDPTFIADRSAMFGAPWNKEAIEKKRPANLVVMRDAFDIVEEQVLGDGREWVLGGEGGLTRADLDAVWPFVWLIGIKGALPDGIFGKERYPKTYAWVERFLAEVKRRKGEVRKPTKVKGDEATRRVEEGRVDGEGKDLVVDGQDPLGLEKGAVVSVGPTDYGVKQRDQGRLVGLTRKEVVLERETKAGKTVLVHFPRIGYSIKKVDEAKL